MIGKGPLVGLCFGRISCTEVCRIHSSLSSCRLSHPLQHLHRHHHLQIRRIRLYVSFHIFFFPNPKEVELLTLAGLYFKRKLTKLLSIFLRH